MAITAILVIASVVLAVLAGWDLDRQKKEVAELEKTWRELAGRLAHEVERHKLAQGTLEFTEKLKGEAEVSIEDHITEIKHLQEEERKAEAEADDESGEGGAHTQASQADPHAIKMARDPHRQGI